MSKNSAKNMLTRINRKRRLPSRFHEDDEEGGGDGGLPPRGRARPRTTTVEEVAPARRGRGRGRAFKTRRVEDVASLQTGSRQQPSEPSFSEVFSAIMPTNCYYATNC